MRDKIEPLSLLLVIFLSLLSLLAFGPQPASSTLETNSASIGFEYEYWNLDESITVPLIPWVQDMTIGVESGFVFSMPGTISITTNNELVSPTTQSVTVTLATQDAHFQLNLEGYLNFSGAVSGEYNFIDEGFDDYFDPLEPIHIEGFNIPLLYEVVVEMGVGIDLDIDAYITADLYRGSTFLESLRWEDSDETKSFSYTVPEVSSAATNTLSVKNITWNYDLALDLSFYAEIDLAVWSGSKDIFTIPYSMPLATEQKTETANVSYTILPPIPPEVGFTTLTNNATVNGTTAISANATDDKSVNRVEFYIDEVKEYTDYNAPYTWSWDTTSYSEGTHTVKVVAYDDDGKSSYQQYSVTVRNVEGIGELGITLVVGVIMTTVIGATVAIYMKRKRPKVRKQGHTRSVDVRSDLS